MPLLGGSKTHCIKNIKHIAWLIIDAWKAIAMIITAKKPHLLIVLLCLSAERETNTPYL